MKLVNVRIKYGGQVTAYDCGHLTPGLGDWVVVKNEDLTYLGQVVTAPVIWNEAEPARPDPGPAGDDTQMAQQSGDSPPEGCPSRGGAWPERGRDAACPLAGAGLNSPAGRRMLRLATPADIERQAENELREREAFEYCQTRVVIQRLEMKLVAVEVIFDGAKTVFYYTADERVDFRLLVKELVSRFRTRIEMRQIGVRHEARMVGGLGSCGRCFCCSGFLSNFAPVSVKMAKEQNVSLSPAKISGVCGRLMCCLAFEQAGPIRPEKGGGRGGPRSPKAAENHDGDHRQ